jgi:hypothetical protein
VYFAAETVRTESDRRRFAANAQQEGLPAPDRGSATVVASDWRRRMGSLWDRLAGREEAVPVYLVEDCFLENPGAGEVLRLAARRDGLKARGNGGSSGAGDSRKPGRP